jgi:hypothetical protein
MYKNYFQKKKKKKNFSKDFRLKENFEKRKNNFVKVKEKIKRIFKFL